MCVCVKSVTTQNPAALGNMLNPSANQPTFINKYFLPDNRNQPRGVGDLRMAASYQPDNDQAAEILRQFSGTPPHSPEQSCQGNGFPPATSSHSCPSSKVRRSKCTICYLHMKPVTRFMTATTLIHRVIRYKIHHYIARDTTSSGSLSTF
ncbi:uncharacterized protein EI90DRAFT_264366 [Cantharellus anzutake]|uniref:uncharacterized protein n=1 Tax=Cantharellus anzutake TaxID=1750568 RepID=UPI001903C0F3|nr:uncharacterized protein EI90DRAFT_264366 [Cantharellus anzutake]KAF8335835.1 hypothetical protein EI90DRAFT_264366 [Cantharellus anzutake]